MVERSALSAKRLSQIINHKSMPHITLEYSSNIRITKDFGTLFSQIHQLLERTLKVNPLNCKSRIICHDRFFISDGDANHAFAHLQIKVLDKHPEEGKKAVGSGAFELLREFFKDEVGGLCFQPSVEVHEMKGDLYYKLGVEEILKGGEK
jgi:5-carboxymethyl-2-hydroxymuconate isomerase